jgi:homoserine dehydrogenase
LRPVRIGILGLGTVGCGTVNVLLRNGPEITRRAGRGLRVVHASVRDLQKQRSCPVDDISLTQDAGSIVNDPDVDVIVELIGGHDPARRLVLQAIAAGKHIVTANKALIAVHGNEIFRAAREQGVMVAFEAAVGGGIPIIKAIREGLSGNCIEWVVGIINGTGNFILTEMRDRGRDFDEVLVDAQRLGYAEADPSFDVEGIDAAHKLTILASIAFGIPLQFDKTYTEGIASVARADVKYAEELGYRIKHLGIARRGENGVELRVHPTLIPERRLIANVDGIMNAILIKGDALGPTMYYGAGAGADPTASAIVADLVDVVRTLTTDPNNRVPHLAFHPDTLSDLKILSMEDVRTSYYLRMRVDDRPGVLAEIAQLLASQQISIEAVIQKEPAEGENVVPLIMLTHRVLEKNMNAALTQIETLESIQGKVVRLRMEHLDSDWK